MPYAVYICGGETECPNDERFMHVSMMGPVCVPKNFSYRTGRAKGFKQTETEIEGLPWKVWMWSGGCDAAGVTAQQRLEEYQRTVARGSKPIALKMKKPTRGRPARDR